MRHVRLLGLLLLLLAFLAVPACAMADDSVGLPVSAPATDRDKPPGFGADGGDVKATARKLPQVQKAMREHPSAKLYAQVFNGQRWDVSLFDTDDRSLVLVNLSPDGKLQRVWTGLAAQSIFAQGHFDRTFPKPWVFVPFALLFLLPFVDPRRLGRLLHLDLLALLSFGGSFFFYNGGHPETAVALFYPPLVYLLVRLLLAGLRPRVGRGRLVPVLPTAALLVGVVALFGARVALNVANDKVVDIGYASVVGADRITHKQQLYVDNDTHGDTYGPVNYLAYIPFELAFPWKGQWDSLPSAHTATMVFDLLTLLGLFLLGRQMRAGPEGRRLGLAMAWAWAAFPFTLFGIMQNTNDGLVALFMVGALLAFNSAGARGAVLGLAAAAKFFPGALLLLFARGRDGGDRRAWLRCVATCAGIFAFAFLIYLPPGGLRELWNCTLGFQLSRNPDFSLWAIDINIGWTQTALEALAVALAVVVAVLPGRRTLSQTAALAGAIVIALQIPSGHWFFFYIMWFAPFALVALFAEHREPAVAAAALPEADDALDARAATAQLALAG